MNQQERIRIFCTELWSWFDRNKRTLPWRDIKEKDMNHKAYLVLVSEVMLQQTQVPRVIILYKKYIQKFPRLEDLAHASNTDVLLAWRGLGYNNRALRLRDAARMIMKGGGDFPTNTEELQKLPGVGHYTAAAIRNFSFGIPTPCIDVNVRRILHRFFVGPEHADGTWKKDDRYLLRLAEEILIEAVRSTEDKVSKVSKVSKVGKGGKGDKGDKGDKGTAAWHAALMDFGSLVCTKNAPRWELFSPHLRSCCKAYGRPIHRIKKVNTREPGREIAGKFVPNRIIRGRIVETLRNHPKGLSLSAIGQHVTVDWTMGDHRLWLGKLLDGLVHDELIRKVRTRFQI